MEPWERLETVVGAGVGSPDTSTRPVRGSCAEKEPASPSRNHGIAEASRLENVTYSRVKSKV